MPLKASDISKVRNKDVRSQLVQKRKKELRQAKLKRRIERKEAEARGEHVEKGACGIHELQLGRCWPLEGGGDERTDILRLSQAFLGRLRIRGSGWAKTTSTRMHGHGRRP